MLTANAVGIRASSAMHEWWTRHEAQSPRQAFAYIQGINQSAHPGQVYGNLSTQIIEDLIQAGGANDLIMQDFTIEQSSQEETHRRFDENLVYRIRDRLFNRQYWDDGEAWLINSTWLALPAYYQITLEPVLSEIGIDEGPFVRLNSWFATEGVRNPRDMSNRLDGIDISPRDDGMQEEDEPNARVRHLLDNTGLITELGRATESGLNNRRSNDPQPPDPNEDTCVICWEGVAENESDTLTRWPQCGHIIHRNCHSRWIWTCHARGNLPRCPICRGSLQGQPEGLDSPVTDEEDRTPNRRYVPSVRGPQGGEGMDDRPNHHGDENEGPRQRGDNRNSQRGSRPILDMSRWAGILASSSTAQWLGKTDQLPPELIQALVNDLCPATLITGRQHALAENRFGSRLGIECYPSDRDGITAALSRTHINAIEGKGTSSQPYWPSMQEDLMSSKQYDKRRSQEGIHSCTSSLLGRSRARRLQTPTRLYALLTRHGDTGPWRTSIASQQSVGPGVWTEQAFGTRRLLWHPSELALMLPAPPRLFSSG